MSLADDWDANNDRPSWILQHKTELDAAADVDIPRERAALSAWLADNKHVVTKALTKQTAASDDEEADDE